MRKRKPTFDLRFLDSRSSRFRSLSCSPFTLSLSHLELLRVLGSPLPWLGLDGFVQAKITG
jgi:hypothetical protein